MKKEVANNREKLQSFYQAALKNRIAAAFWKLPGEHNIQALAGQAAKIRSSDLQLKQAKGFVFAPFDTQKKEILFIHPLFIYEGNPIPGSGFVLPRINGDPALLNGSAGKREFEELVGKGIATIKKKELEKVVLSRCEKTELPEDFSPLDFFQRLSAEHPGAFTSLVSIPGTGTWIGATPELLLEVKKEELRTVALAATRNADDTTREWTSKELEEQAFVKNYILSLFEELNSDQPRESSLDNLRAGNLLHLYSEFRLKTDAAGISKLADKLLFRLHPTPAVAGIPTKQAIDFILAEEGYDRQFYSGFLGPVNIAKATQLYVNLRCMQLFEKHALLYAGAGITADSQPEKEWEETEQKMRTLLDLL